MQQRSESDVEISVTGTRSFLGNLSVKELWKLVYTRTSYDIKKITDRFLLEHGVNSAISLPRYVINKIKAVDGKPVREFLHP